MAAVPPGSETGAATLLAGEARATRARLIPPILLGLGIAACGVAQAFLIARLLAMLLGHGAAGWPDLAAAAVLALLMAALGIAQERTQQAAGEEAKARLRDRLFARLLAAGPADERAVGEKSALVVERVEAMEGYFARWIPAAMLAVLAPLLVAGVAAAADPLSGLILLGAGLLVPIAQAVSGIGAGLASRRQFAALQRLSGRFLDRMRGLPILVLHNQQDAEAGRLGAAAEELRARTMRVLRLAFVATGAMELIVGIALASLAYRHGHLVSGTHPAPVEALFCLLLVPVFFVPLRAFAGAYHEQLAARGAAADLAPLLAAPEPEGLLLEEVPPKVTVTFHEVRLTYDASRPPALDGLSFRVLPGETLLLTGPSGSGKTSVLRLLMGFRRPDGGRIAINGHDVTLLRPAELRRLSSYVGQRAHIFRATIRENIRFARPDADDAAVEAAARAAQVSDFAADLPQGLDTLVGDGGFGLSGGQAQRVAVARAFLRDSPLVLLDEPTSHLDPGTEAAVLDALRRLCVGRTAIVATHARAARGYFGRTLDLGAMGASADRMAGN
ncbi:thiol reductant ABC exporter subunit CydD [Roseomonas sp. PWR1]|uniref:Thiol reductant ABC exporter subunit CydD n=1 Tax=Roseomonas nitratireducens TaxID=2820810 RepID=A0ABS4AXE7_9PROT|nr:thiol reductant ABC exporter subunit CydD [Neoroseomonas nitratireducens]MBP0465478.1 thiol reductant ABC exporter subunit CydD [Neoroseomonas nitratireducens]